MNEAPVSQSPKIREKFYQQVGQCITTWAWIEDSLFSLCHVALGCHKERAAVVFGRTPTLETRLALTDELMRSVFPKEGRKNGGHDPQIIKEWAEIQQKLLKLAPVRNAMAHRPVTEVVRLLTAQRQDIYKYLDSLEIGEGLTFHVGVETDSEMVFHLHSRDLLRRSPPKIGEIKSHDLEVHLVELRKVGGGLLSVLKKTRAKRRKARPRQLKEPEQSGSE